MTGACGPPAEVPSLVYYFDYPVIADAVFPDFPAELVRESGEGEECGCCLDGKWFENAFHG